MTVRSRAPWLTLTVVGCAFLALACGEEDPSPTLPPAPAPSATVVATASPLGGEALTATSGPLASSTPSVTATNGPVGAFRELVVPWDPSGIGDQYRLYLFSADGSEPRRLTPEGTEIIGSETQPAWSPDGERLVFVGFVGDGVDLFAINVDGSGLTNLTNAPSWYSHPVWSPDGRSIAYVESTADFSELYVMDADGSNSRPLTASPGREAEPSWSPDGRRIAVLRWNPGPPVPIDGATPMSEADATATAAGWSPGAIVVVDIASGGEELMVSLAGYAEGPLWSPDGALLAYADEDVAGRRVIVAAVEVGALSTPLLPPLRSSLPRWVPGTSRLSLVAFDPGGSQGQLVTVNVDGSDMQPLSEHAGRLDWSPDGGWFTVVVERLAPDGSSTGLSNLYLISADGASEQALLSAAAIGPGPAWRP